MHKNWIYSILTTQCPFKQLSPAGCGKMRGHKGCLERSAQLQQLEREKGKNFACKDCLWDTSYLGSATRIDSVDFVTISLKG